MSKSYSLDPAVAENLERLKTSRAVSIAASVAFVILGFGLPEDWHIRWVMVGFGSVMACLFMGDHIIEKRAAYEWHQAHLQVFLEKNLPQTEMKTAPTSRVPVDGGETPTPEFLEQLFLFAKDNANRVPDVRQIAQLTPGVNNTRAQAMIVRLVTWGAIIGRVERGSSGVIAEHWTHERARSWMIDEKPDYAPKLRSPPPE